MWSQPMTKVAVQLQVSSSYLSRVCNALQVPRPERGYWAKLQVGKAPPAPPLPPAKVGDLQEWCKSVALPPMAPPRLDNESTPARSTRRRLVSQTHELIAGARKHFEATRKIEDGGYLKPYKSILVDITVSQGQLVRALEFANTLFNELEARGHRVALAHRGQSLGRITIDEDEVPKKRTGERYRPLWAPRDPTIVYIGEVPIGLALVETSESVLMRWVKGGYIRDADYSPPHHKRFHPDHSWTSMQDVRTGRLRLIAYAPRHDVECSLQWQEAKGASLIDKISIIAAALPAFAIEAAAKDQAAELAWKLKCRQWDEAAERRRRADDQKKVQASYDESRKQLERIIGDWANAVSVDRFFDGIENRIASLSEEEAKPILERLNLAREFVGTLDPMRYFLAWRTPLERHKPAYDHYGDSQSTDNDE